MRKVFLDELPKGGGTGISDNQINWKNSIGYKIKFIYDDFIGEIEIINYFTKEQKIDIKYNDNKYSIKTFNLINCRLSNLLGLYIIKYRFNIGEIITTKLGKIKIIDQIKIKQKYSNVKGYKYKCLIDNNIDQISESNLMKGKGCNVCSNRKILKNKNDIATINPDLIKYFVNIEDVYEYSNSSGKTIDVKCPNCDNVKNMKIYQLYKRGFSCPNCGDGISYPNKFIRNFLDQLNEQYIPEYSPDWAFIKHDNLKLNGKKKYDNLLVNRNEVWEVHGLQHYKEGFSKINKNIKTLKEEQENDKIKKELAEKNGFKYIVVDARYSEMEYIKNSILNLAEIHIYDLSLINWLKCHEYACSSLVKIACDYWSDGINNVREISKIMNLNYQTIIKYLKQGAKLGWCDYDPKKEMKINGKLNGGKNKKSIIQLSLIGEYLAEFKSISEAGEKLHIKTSSISICCKNINKTCKNFRWMYKDDYYNNMDKIKPIKKIKYNSRIVIQLDLNYNYINKWDSLHEADRNTGISFKNISLVCQNKRKHACGFKWMYKEDYDKYIEHKNESA